jgi:hypothetical protein
VVAFQDYGVSFSDWVFLVFNLIYHLGVIYDLVRDIVGFFDDFVKDLESEYEADAEAVNGDAETIGRYFGELLRQTFKD